MNNPIELLYKEHEIITQAVKSTQALKSLIENDNEAYKNGMRKKIDFFRNYADKYHHAKEEKVLFPEMNKKNEILSDGIIKEMLENHEDFRELLQNIESLIEKNDYFLAHTEFEKYAIALSDHIAVENEEVFQIAETLFEEDELEKIYFKFLDSDSELGDSTKTSLEKAAI